MASFAERLKALRKERGLTQDALAQILGISRSAVSCYEASRQNIPDPAILGKLADYFGVSIDYLLGHTDDRRPYSPALGKITLEEALRELLNAEHVMFHGLPLGEFNEETKEDLLAIVQAMLEHRAEKLASRQEAQAKRPKKSGRRGGSKREGQA